MTFKSGTARKVRKVIGPAQQRRSYLMSDHFEAAAKAAIARHHDAGLPVHGEQDGSIVEIAPRDDKERPDT